MKTINKILIFAAILCTNALFAQETKKEEEKEEKPKPIAFTGAFTAFAEGYEQKGLKKDRRPRELNGLNGALTVTLFDKVELPFTFFTASNASPNVTLPFNQLGASPTFGKYLKVHGGYFSTKFSEFILSDMRMLGAGVEYSPKRGRIAAISGITQQAMNPSEDQTGYFRRRLDAAQIGLGNKKNNIYLWFTALRAADDSLSLEPFYRRDEGVQQPSANAIAAISGGFRLKQWAKYNFEAALSSYTHNILSDTIDVTPYEPRLAVVQSVLPFNASTKTDAAGSSNLDLKLSDKFGVKLEAKYVGPGYKSAGILMLENDIFDLTVAPRLKLSNFSATGKFGRRENNLSDSRLTTTTKILYQTDINWEISEKITLATSYRNFGVKASTRNDTFRIANISQNFSFSPSFEFSSKKATNSLVFDYSYQDYTDKNIVSGTAGNGRHHSGSINHTLILTKSKWSFTSSMMYIDGIVDDEKTTILTLGETISKSFFKKKLKTSLSFTYNRTATAEDTEGGQNITFKASYKISKLLRIEGSVNRRKFDYADPNRTDFQETLSRIGLGFNF